MGRAFLSHSSADKNYVEPISKLLGNDRCIYDARTFEAGMQTISEIFTGLSDTDVFVYFISDAALNSEWVKIELNNVKEKLRCDPEKLKIIFPIIIDKNVTHNDERIAPFLRSGAGCYNLRHIDNYKIAYKKICSQLIRMQMESDPHYDEKVVPFYGRDEELRKFKSIYDDCTKPPLKCCVFTGIEGIGRKSLLCEALREVGNIRPYYVPQIIRLSRNDTIDDLILKISELGFGDYTIGDITALSSVDSKINILAELLKQVQKYNEHLIIYDDLVIVGFDQNIKYWFERALNEIDPELTVSVLTRVRLSYSTYNNYAGIYFSELLGLTKSEQSGMLRVCSEHDDFSFSRDDIQTISDKLNGYPPQILYCVDLAKEFGVEYVKKNKDLLAKRSSVIAAEVVGLAIPDESKKGKCLGFLSFLCSYEVTPISVVYEVINLNSDYYDIYVKLLSLTICKLIGNTRESVVVNTVIQDYIQRNKYAIPDDIKSFMTSKIHEFMEKIDNKRYEASLDFTEITYYVKENLKAGKEIPDYFLLSTVYLKAVIDLYNDHKNEPVINLVMGLKESHKFETYDDTVQRQLQYYLCLALAREAKKTQNADAFNEATEFFRAFRDIQGYVAYNFLKGFMFRIIGKLDLAEQSFRNVLSKRSNHKQALRELVTVYRLMELYPDALSLAKDNYQANPDNMYQIQAYVDCIVKKETITDDEIAIMEHIASDIEEININTPTDMYYEVKAQYLLHIKKRSDDAIRVLQDGCRKYSGSIYIHRDLFDVFENQGNVSGMKTEIETLEQLTEGENSSFKSVYIYREALYSAHAGITYGVISVKLNRQQAQKYISQKVVEIALKKVQHILGSA